MHLRISGGVFIDLGIVHNLPNPSLISGLAKIAALIWIWKGGLAGGQPGKMPIKTCAAGPALPAFRAFLNPSLAGRLTMSVRWIAAAIIGESRSGCRVGDCPVPAFRARWNPAFIPFTLKFGPKQVFPHAAVS
jgi:hypothetical protein